MGCFRELILVLVGALAFQPAVAGCEVDGKVLIVRGVRGLVYGRLRDSQLILSNGHQEQTLTIDHHGRFHVDLSEGTWTVIRVTPNDRNHLEIGQKFRVPPQERIVKIDIRVQVR
jgi:hypothetical protein